MRGTREAKDAWRRQREGLASPDEAVEADTLTSSPRGSGCVVSPALADLPPTFQGTPVLPRPTM